MPTTFTEQKENNYILFTEYAHPLPFGQLMLGLRNENVATILLFQPQFFVRQLLRS